MPAALRRKKHASGLKKWKPKRKKTLPVRKKGSFKRGEQARPKILTIKHGKNSIRKPNSPSLNDAKVLRQLERSNKYMTSKAKGLMISFVKNLYRRVSVEAERLRRKRKRASIGSTEMRTALKSVMPSRCKRCIESTHQSGGTRFSSAS